MADQISLGIVGEFIDALDDEKKDRIVRAQHWTEGVFVSGRHRCLISHVFPAEMTTSIVGQFDMWLRRTQPRRLLMIADSLGDPGSIPCEVAEVFDNLVVENGLESVVRACKLRAGASLEDLKTHDAETPTREPVHV